MEIDFFETSSLIKRYVFEVGSDWVRGRCRPSPDRLIVVCELSIAEVASAVARRYRQGLITASERDLFFAQFLAHCHTEYTLVPVTRQMLEEAGSLCFRHPLRSLDAIHLAAALGVARVARRHGLAITFVSADDVLLTAAQVEGLTVENPNWHP